MKKDPVLVLQHISDSIKYTDLYTYGDTLESFLAYNNREKQRTVALLMGIIGKAVSYIPEEFRQCYQQIQWENIDGLTLKIATNHFDADLELVWVVVTELPQLKREIDKILMDYA